MRTFEDLTKEEREKLNLYWSMKSGTQLRAAMLCIPPLMGFILSAGLILSLSFYALLIGTGIVCISFIYIVVILLQLETDSKYLYLAFDMESSMEDMFKIKKSDTSNLTKRWKKVEK